MAVPDFVVLEVKLLLCTSYRYEAVITIVKPSTRILSTMYYAREPGKIM